MSPDKHSTPAKRDHPINFWMSAAEVAALDAWRAKNQVWSRSDALRRMVAAGLSHASEQLVEDNAD